MAKSGYQNHSGAIQQKKLKAIKAPTWAPLFDGDLAGLAYALKNEFDRKETYHNRDRKLRGKLVAQLLLLLHHTGLDARMTLFGIKPIYNDGRLIFRILK